MIKTDKIIRNEKGQFTKETIPYCKLYPEIMPRRKQHHMYGKHPIAWNKNKKTGQIPWNKGNWNQGHCIDCNEKVYTKNAKRCRKCYIKAGIQSKRQLGSNNPLWKGGTTKLRGQYENLPRTKSWKKAVFERDKYSCQLCRQVGGILNAHHILSIKYLFQKYKIKNIKNILSSKILFDINIGITLCEKCHKLIHKGGE